jgi:hypothetical protein
MITEEELFRSIFFETTYIEEMEQQFDKVKFETLPSKEKLKYLKTIAKKIGAGSARIVFPIDPNSVIKLAKNDKGLAQNNVEIDIYRAFQPDVVAKIFDYDENDVWLRMERATKFNVADFKSFVGISFREFMESLEYWYSKNMSRQTFYNLEKPKNYDVINETVFFQDLINIIGNYNMPIGDIKRPSSWGIVNRNGKKTPVLIDFGLTQDILNQYYLNV